MAAPRPVIKRSNSKVRFSRADMSPIGTMASDSTVHGVHGQHSHHPQPQNGQSSGQAPSNPYAYDQPQEHYTIDSYPFSEEISLSTSNAPEDHPLANHQNSYYREVAPEDELSPHDSESQRYQSNDGYTATPPRVGGSRRWSVAQRPGLDTLLSADQFDSGDVSPRGSTAGGIPYENPSRAAYQGSPHARPASALRSSLVMPNAPGSPQQRMGGHDGMPGRPDLSPYQNSAGRASVPNMHTPPRRMLDQHRGSAPPEFGSPNIGSPQFGSPRGSPNPAIRRYPEYETAVPDRLSPVPPYGSPRGSYARPAPAYGADGRDREWEEPRKNDRFAGRLNSDTTLQGDYEEDRKGSYDKRGSGQRGMDEKGYASSYRRARSMSSDSGKSMAEGMRRRTTREVEDDGDSYHVKGGVFSQLLRLTGRSSTLRRRVSSRGASISGAGELPTMKSLGLKKSGSVASTIFGAEELDRDDPRVTGQKKKKRRNSWSDLPFSRAGRDSDANANDPKRRRRASIQYHVADLLTRQQFILKLAKALMAFGAPSHRIESQLSATALVLEIDAQFIHLPSIVIASFGDVDTRTSETHFVKTGGGLDLGKLHRVHNIYKAVVHDELDAGEGTRRIHELLKAPLEYNLWQRIVLAFLCSSIIAPLGFGGSLIDGLAAGVLGILLSFLQLNVASKSAMYSNIFEISIATVVSFTARGLATTGIFCYQAVASAGVVLILPGYTILCGSLELASKNIVSGSVRMVYAIIYSLFLGFGITIGSDLFYVIDRPARRAATAAAAAAKNVIKLEGQFIPSELLASFDPNVNSSTPLIPFNGTFVFTNSTVDAVNSNLQQGNVICQRPDGLPWYRQGMPPLYLLLLVPLFSILLSMWNMQPLKSRQLPVMVVISCIGFLTNTMANHYIFDRSDVVSAIGAFVIGILGNIYSRVFGGTAFTSMVTGVLFLVPSGIAAAGGLAMTNNPNHSDSYSQGLIIGFRMVQVAIGITVGLFGSGLLIYSFGRKKGAALFAF